MGVRPICLAITALLLAACAQKNIDNKDAVRQAVMDYLSSPERQKQTGLDMSSMDVIVTEMRFEKESARVAVAFRIKNSDAGMNMSYNLDRKGDKWVVRPRSESDSPHGTAIPPADGVALPPGHPGVGSKAPAAGSKE